MCEGLHIIFSDNTDQESNAVAFLGSLAFGGQSWLSRLRTLAKALECSCLFLLLSGFGRNSNNE